MVFLASTDTFFIAQSMSMTSWQSANAVMHGNHAKFLHWDADFLMHNAPGQGLSRHIREVPRFASYGYSYVLAIRKVCTWNKLTPFCCFLFLFSFHSVKLLESLHVFSEFRTARFFRLRIRRIERFQQSKPCAGSSIHILIRSATYQPTSIRSLGFDFNGLVRAIYSVCVLSRILFVVCPAQNLSIVSRPRARLHWVVCRLWGGLPAWNLRKSCQDHYGYRTFFGRCRAHLSLMSAALSVHV